MKNKDNKKTSIWTTFGLFSLFSLALASMSFMIFNNTQFQSSFSQQSRNSLQNKAQMNNRSLSSQNQERFSQKLKKKQLFWMQEFVNKTAKTSTIAH